MEVSERGLQRKQLNDDFRRILKEHSPGLFRAAQACSEVGKKEEEGGLDGEANVDHDALLAALHRDIRELTALMCSTYMSYPLLCGRFSEVAGEEEEEDGEETLTSASSVAADAQSGGPSHGHASSSPCPSCGGCEEKEDDRKSNNDIQSSGVEDGAVPSDCLSHGLAHLSVMGDDGADIGGADDGRQTGELEEAGGSVATGIPTSGGDSSGGVANPAAAQGVAAKKKKKGGGGRKQKHNPIKQQLRYAMG